MNLSPILTLAAVSVRVNVLAKFRLVEVAVSFVRRLCRVALAGSKVNLNCSTQVVSGVGVGVLNSVVA
jgi:hypothetical protein